MFCKVFQTLDQLLSSVVHTLLPWMTLKVVLPRSWGWWWNSWVKMMNQLVACVLVPDLSLLLLKCILHLLVTWGISIFMDVPFSCRLCRFQELWSLEGMSFSFYSVFICKWPGDKNQLYVMIICWFSYAHSSPQHCFLLSATLLVMNCGWWWNTWLEVL